MRDNLAKERIGTVGKNKFGSNMEVFVYKNTHEIWVKFDKGKVVRSTWQNFCEGKVKVLMIEAYME